MQITWKSIAGEEMEGRIEAHIMPYVNALGINEAAALLLEFGGKYIHLHNNAPKKSSLARRIGPLKAIKLYGALGTYHQNAGAVRVPTGKVFLARYLRGRGKNVQDIATALQMTDVSVRKYLRSDEDMLERNLRYEAARRDQIIAEAVEDGIVVYVNPPANSAAKTLAQSSSPHQKSSLKGRS